MRSFVLIVAGLVGACFASAADAQQCGPLQRALALDLTPVSGNDARVTVPIVVNGFPKQFIVDTGARFSRLSEKTVTSLGIKSVTSRVRMLSNAGTISDSAYASVDLGIGPMNIKSYEVLVEPNPSIAADGFFGPDLMVNYDIDMDFSGHKLNYFLPNHCEGHVVYWPATSVAVVPYRGWAADNGDADMKLPVLLDGHEVIARVNTGRTRTLLDANTANELFGLTPDSPGAAPMGTVAGETDHKVFGWVFKKLEIGDVTINNPSIQIAPNLIGTKTPDTLEADSRVRRITDNRQPTLTIGMDLLSKLHIYVAIKEKKLYVTAANTSPPAAAPATAQPAAANQ